MVHKNAAYGIMLDLFKHRKYFELKHTKLNNTEFFKHKKIIMWINGSFFGSIGRTCIVVGQASCMSVVNERRE